jgi:hypothetical protein
MEEQEGERRVPQDGGGKVEWKKRGGRRRRTGREGKGGMEEGGLDVAQRF